MRRTGRRERRAFIAKMGARCNYCGCVSRLSLDRIEPRHRCGFRVSSGRKWKFEYSLHAAEGNLQVLCRHCNAVKGRRSGYIPPLAGLWRRRAIEAGWVGEGG